jgi:proline iminopeptidase
LEHPRHTDALLYLCGTGLAWSQGPRQAYGAERLVRLGEQAARYQALRARERSPAEERELRLLTESTNYFDRANADELAARHLDERFTVNAEVNAALSIEAFGLDEDALVERCRTLDVQALVLHGEGAPRPSRACDSLAAALPRVTRVVVPAAGHEPWIENPVDTRDALRRFLLDR